MSGGQKGFTPTIDLGRAISAVGVAVKNSVKVTRLARSGRKPTKAMKAFREGNIASKKERAQFGKIAELTFYQDRYTIRKFGDVFEAWDADTHDVFGPFPTHADALTFVRGL